LKPWDGSTRSDASRCSTASAEANRTLNHIIPESEADVPIQGDTCMNKGKDSKKQNKKKPLRTLMEKRAAKRAKKETKVFSLDIK
jgi:hypothetical protein